VEQVIWFRFSQIGTGASSVIGQESMKRGILTVGIICTPFSFEGPKRTKVLNFTHLTLQDCNRRNQRIGEIGRHVDHHSK
jgi:hypothetical protein